MNTGTQLSLGRLKHVYTVLCVCYWHVHMNMCSFGTSEIHIHAFLHLLDSWMELKLFVICLYIILYVLCIIS